MSQASASSFPKNLFFELREYSQKAGHRSAGWRGQVEGFRERDETDTEVVEFLKRRQQIRY